MACEQEPRVAADDIDCAIARAFADKAPPELIEELTDDEYLKLVAAIRREITRALEHADDKMSPTARGQTDRHGGNNCLQHHASAINPAPGRGCMTAVARPDIEGPIPLPLPRKRRTANPRSRVCGYFAFLPFFGA